MPPLPDPPCDPRVELTAWCTTVLNHLTLHRSFLRKAMSEMEERPLVTEAACRGPHCAHEVLLRYVGALRALFPELAFTTFDSWVEGRCEAVEPAG